MLIISGMASGAEMGYSDPTGDVENDGMEAVYLPNIDIEKLEVEETSEQVTIRMTVSGNINLNPEGRLFYHYYVKLDHDGDGVTDTDIELDTSSAFTYACDYDTEIYRDIDESMLAGNGTPTLTITIPREWLGNAPAIVDVFGTTEVGDFMDYADDYINKYFEGGTPIGDGSGDDDTGDDDTGDDDTGDDDTGDDDTGDDDTGDDDTGDDDTGDDDTGDDDTGDDDTGDGDKSDSPGFELAIIIPVILFLVVLAGVWGRKRN